MLKCEYGRSHFDSNSQCKGVALVAQNCNVRVRLWADWGGPPAYLSPANVSQDLKLSCRRRNARTEALTRRLLMSGQVCWVTLIMATFVSCVHFRKIVNYERRITDDYRFNKILQGSHRVDREQLHFDVSLFISLLICDLSSCHLLGEI